MSDTFEQRIDQFIATAPPIPVLLFCPRCHLQHIDEPDERTPEWDNPPHRSHLCHGCGCIWRPADVATNGVRAIETYGKADNWSPDQSPVGAAPRTDKPVAWRWRYVRNRGPGYWTVRQTPIEPMPAQPGLCAIEVEPLFLSCTPATEEIVEALDKVLATSGARGRYHALEYADAVERAEALLSRLTAHQNGASHEER